MRLVKDFFKGFFKGMKNFGTNISMIVNSILLSVVYFVGVGLTAIFAKLFRKKFLDLKLNKQVKTYWKDLNLKKKKIDDYYRTF
jgi:hypothetical protein